MKKDTHGHISAIFFSLFNFTKSLRYSYCFIENCCCCYIAFFALDKALALLLRLLLSLDVIVAMVDRKLPIARMRKSTPHMKTPLELLSSVF